MHLVASWSVRQDARGAARQFGELRVLQPRQADGGVGQLGQDGAAVGRGDGGVRECVKSSGRSRGTSIG